MKSLSDLLAESAERVKQIENLVTETGEKSRIALESRRQELDNELDRKKQEFDAAVSQAQDESRSWLEDVKNSIERQIAAMRANVEKWDNELKGKNAERAAKRAEDNAAAAKDMADYFLSTAEWAAVQARLARTEADDVAKQA